MATSCKIISNTVGVGERGGICWDRAMNDKDTVKGRTKRANHKNHSAVYEHQRTFCVCVE